MKKSIPLLTKLRLTVAAGAIPGTTIAAIGDFFSPIGGWLLPLLVGVIATITVAILLVVGTRGVKAASDADESLRGWWDGPPHKQVGVWILSAIAISGLVFGSLSQARAGKGGLLAQKISAVSEAQQLAGFMRESLETQARTAAATEAIRDTVKKETSADPRKELANLGQPWSEQGAYAAIRRQDPESLQLYLDGGMKLQASRYLIDSVLDKKLWDLLDTFEQSGFHEPEAGNCKSMVERPYKFLLDRQEPGKIDSNAVRAYRIFCGHHHGMTAHLQSECRAVTARLQRIESDYAAHVREHGTTPNVDIQYYRDSAKTCRELAKMID